jgi:hypothetical protein
LTPTGGLCGTTIDNSPYGGMMRVSTASALETGEMLRTILISASLTAAVAGLSACAAPTTSLAEFHAGRGGPIGDRSRSAGIRCDGDGPGVEPDRPRTRGMVCR